MANYKYKINWNSTSDIFVPHKPKRNRDSPYKRSDRVIVAKTFKEMVTAKKPSFAQQWTQEDQDNLFEINVSEMKIVDGTTSVGLRWNFKEHKLYCCTSPQCFLGYPGPFSKDWWGKFKQKLRDKGFEKKLKPIALHILILIPEISVEMSRGRICSVGPSRCHSLWQEAHAT